MRRSGEPGRTKTARVGMAARLGRTDGDEGDPGALEDFLGDPVGDGAGGDGAHAGGDADGTDGTGDADDDDNIVDGDRTGTEARHMSKLGDYIQRMAATDEEREHALELLREHDAELSAGGRQGLVFERKRPETTPTPDVRVTVGQPVAIKGGDMGDVFVVSQIGEDGTVTYVSRVRKDDVRTGRLDDLVSVAEFGDPIYPALEKIDEIQAAPDDIDTQHMLIEADNYHALQALMYSYEGKIDCIYIDPPYNTGARDWKYNNDYVDSADTYRHSKWLSFMERRLLLAKKLLNPKDSVLIVTIDEKEYLRLGLLLEQIFTGARIQMISSVINPKGQSRNGLFARTDEYIFYVMIGSSHICRLPLDETWRTGKSTTTNDIRWQYLRRPGKTGQVHRQDSPGCFYPIFVTDDLRIAEIGDALPLSQDKDTVIAPEGTTAIWPMCADGTEGCYQISPDNLRELYKQGYIHITEKSTSGIHYLKQGERQKVENGTYALLGHRSNDNSVIVEASDAVHFIPGTQWNISYHNAGDYGKKIINTILGDARFTFPKSIYAELDTIRFCVADKPDAIILDFFAGSGTTMHAVNLLNAEDGGHRRCIMVTNNELSDTEAKELAKQGYKPGDDEWERLGIARYVTWPRTTCAIRGVDVNGDPIKGTYKGTDPERKMSDGLPANATFFKLRFLSRRDVELGAAAGRLLSMLWVKAGMHGPCPDAGDVEDASILAYPDQRFAVLFDMSDYAQFREIALEHAELRTLFVGVASEATYRSIAADMPGREVVPLWGDYLDMFDRATR